MQYLEVMKQRHSVRKFTDKSLSESIVNELITQISLVNQMGDLSIELITNEPKAFGSMIRTFGRIKNCRNYLVVKGKNDDFLDWKAGLYGERIVLKAQELGLNSCWVAGGFKQVEGTFTVRTDERVVCYILLGYGENNGISHKTKSFDEVVRQVKYESAPLWFKRGIEAALLAPTAMNKQDFVFAIDADNEEIALVISNGSKYSTLDCGIAASHFELASENSVKLSK